MFIVKENTMSLLKHYLTLLDFVRKTISGNFEQKDFDKAYDAFIEIALYARKFGTKNSAIKEVFDTCENDKIMAENLYKTSKSHGLKKEIDCIDYTKQILDNASNGDLEVKGLTDVLFEVTRQNEHYDNFQKIDVWAYEREGY